jgi:signal transduction histidine kinase
MLEAMPPPTVPPDRGSAADRGQGRFVRTVHLGFVLVLSASILRYAVWHGVTWDTLPQLGSGVLFGLLYLAGAALWGGRGPRRQTWLLVVVGAWTPLTLAVPSYGWCAVPLFFLVLRVLPGWSAVPVIAVLAFVAALAQVTLATMPFPWNPSPALEPVVVAVMSVVVYRQMHREAVQRQALIEELTSTRDALARSERTAGVLQERARLSQEIHDTIAQGLSSMHLLLNAADQDWATAPGQARTYVRQAAAAARENLAEARRFIHDLAPPALDGSSLADALQRLCTSVAEQSGMRVRFRVDGDPHPLGVDVEVALLRVAQGALANVTQHAKASTSVVTVSYLSDAVTLDIADDGVGFDPSVPSTSPGRGFGLRAIRQRVEALGGTTTVESAPLEGTMLAVALPVDGQHAPARRADGEDL